MAKQVRRNDRSTHLAVRKRATAGRKRVAPHRPRAAAQGQIERGVREIERAMGDIQRGLARAEQRIETDARKRIRELQNEARAQMRALEATRREARRLLGKLSEAAGGSWDDVVKMLDSMVNEARTTAGGVIDRFRSVLS